MTAECRKTIKRIPGCPPGPCGRPAIEDGLCQMHLSWRKRKREKIEAWDAEYEPPLVGVADCATELAKWQNWYREAILRAHAEGESLRAIANAAGISHEKVRQIVARQ